MYIRSLASLSALLLLSLAAPAAASPPASDRQPDAVGDVVKTYADGHVSTGTGQSDILSTKLRPIHIGGVGKAVDVGAHLKNVNARMFQNGVHMRVRYIASTGYVARSVTHFKPRGAANTRGTFRGENCVPYPRRAGKVDMIAISYPDDCWPVAKSVRVKVWVRYDFSPNGAARDFGHAGPIAIP